jgi:small subunit ribosomal protein S5
MATQANRRNYNQAGEQSDVFEKVLEIRRVSQKTKGGNNISFSALVVTGDRKGQVGLGQTKAPNVVDAIKKSIRLANRDLVKIPLESGTIPFETKAKFKAAMVLLKPAPKGTGLIAGGAVRSIVEAAGVTNVVTKMLGSNNKSTNAKATFAALKKIELLSRKYKQMRTSKTAKVKKKQK